MSILVCRGPLSGAIPGPRSRLQLAFSADQWPPDIFTSRATHPAGGIHQEVIDFAAAAMQAMLFVNKLNAGWRYLGANVRLGDVDRSILQYRREPTAPLRVIYGDLHCVDLDVTQSAEVKELGLQSGPAALLQKVHGNEVFQHAAT